VKGEKDEREKGEVTREKDEYVDRASIFNPPSSTFQLGVPK
jgi:hypothetical protein